MSDKREESKPEVTFEAQPEAVDRTEAMFKAYLENRTLSEKATAILMLECLGHRDRAIDAVIQRVYREWSDEIIETAEKLLCHADELDAADEPAAVIMAAGVLAGNNER
jgi:hypothetical protein